MPSFSSTRSLMRFTVSVGSMSNSISLPAQHQQINQSQARIAQQCSMQPKSSSFSARPHCSQMELHSLKPARPRQIKDNV
jgi:hypothetical protein